MPVELYLHCPHCAAQRRFEQPPCLDGHGPDCPELACTECGEAVLIGSAGGGTDHARRHTERHAA